MLLSILMHLHMLKRDGVWFWGIKTSRAGPTGMVSVVLSPSLVLMVTSLAPFSPSSIEATVPLAGAV